MSKSPAIKIKYVNLEKGMPDASSALRILVDAIGTNKRMGVRALVVIHGWGSSGKGGVIKEALKKKLEGISLRGMVEAYSGGENWADNSRAFLNKCPELKEFSREIEGNPGITVILLK